MSETRTLSLSCLGLAVLVLIAAFFWMNRGYGEVSERGYQYATALFSACNRKDEAKLHTIAEMVDQSREAGEISQQEAGWLQAIIELGLTGHWSAASQEVRSLMEDQLVQAADLQPSATLIREGARRL